MTSKNILKSTYLATAPNKEWIWDVSFLRSVDDGIYFYLYNVVDLYGRYVVHFEIHESKNDEIAKEVIHNALKKKSINLKLDQIDLRGVNEISDGNEIQIESVTNGRSKKEARFLPSKDLQIPTEFASIEQARSWCDSYYKWYNEKYRPKCTNYITPQKYYAGEAEKILEKRNRIIAEFYANRK